MITDDENGEYPKGWHIYCKSRRHPYEKNTWHGYGRDVLFKDILAIGNDGGMITVVSKYLFILPEKMDNKAIENLYCHQGKETKISINTVPSVEDDYKKEIEIVEFAKYVMLKENINNNRFTCSAADLNIFFSKAKYKKKTKEIFDYLSGDLEAIGRFVGFVDPIERGAEEFQAVSLLHVYGFTNHKKYREMYNSIVSDTNSETYKKFLKYEGDTKEVFGFKRLD